MNLITRLDFDGIVCAAMLYKMETIPAINFSTPQTIEDGGLLDLIQPGDIVAHLPYHPDAGMWFHNHDTSHVDSSRLSNVRGKWGVAGSASKQVFDFYGADKIGGFAPIVDVASKIGSASLTEQDILNPTGWVMVAYTLDPRFSMDYSYGMEILNAMMAGKSAEDILALPTVARRVELYNNDESTYRQTLEQFTSLDGNVIVTDFRGADRAPRGNRFYVFTKYPQGNVHIRLDAVGGMRVKVSCSKSIFNKTCNVHIGQLMEEHNGGGPAGAGTCFIGKRVADERIPTIIAKLKQG